MIRVGVSALLSRSILRPSTVQIREFTGLRYNGLLQSLHKRPSFWSPATYAKGSRSYMAERPMIQEAQGISWKRLGMTAVCTSPISSARYSPKLYRPGLLVRSLSWTPFSIGRPEMLFLSLRDLTLIAAFSTLAVVLPLLHWQPGPYSSRAMHSVSWQPIHVRPLFP